MATHVLVLDAQSQHVSVAVFRQQLHQSLPVVDGRGIQEDGHVPHHTVWELED